MKELILKVDRVEEGIAVCYAPVGDDMIDIPLPEELVGIIKDGVTLTIRLDGDTIASVTVVEEDAPKADERRARLNHLFGRK